MASLTDLVTSRMTPEVMQKLAGLAGISSTNAKRAIDALIPTQLYDLVSMGTTEAGANRLLSVLKEQKGTESFAHVLLAGDAMQSQAKAGDALQSAIYGDDLSHRIGSVASSIGIPQGAASSLMGMIMPTVVGVLGREVRERGLDAAGLVNLLRGERETVERAMPAETGQPCGPPAGSRGVTRRRAAAPGTCTGAGKPLALAAACSARSWWAGSVVFHAARRHHIQPESARSGAGRAPSSAMATSGGQ